LRSIMLARRKKVEENEPHLEFNFTFKKKHIPVFDTLIHSLAQQNNLTRGH
jgi:hypothetical protein